MTCDKRSDSASVDAREAMVPWNTMNRRSEMETNSSDPISPNSERTSKLAEMLSTAFLSVREDGIRIARQDGSSARKMIVGLVAWWAASAGRTEFASRDKMDRV